MSGGPFQSGKKRAMNWPTAGQYNEAVQNLHVSMSDPELRGGTAVADPGKMPMPYAGNFADVYQVHCAETGNRWAVKFFKW